MAGAGLAILATRDRTLWLLTVAATLQGPGIAAASGYRFAAVEFVLPGERETALSIAVLGGAVAAFGPEVARSLRLALPFEFMGSFVALVIIYVVELLIVSLVQLRQLEQRPDVAARAAAALSASATPKAPAPFVPTGGAIELTSKSTLPGAGSASYSVVPTTPGAAALPGSDIESEPRHRSCCELFCRVDYLGAAFCGGVGYSAMAGIMNANSLLMLAAGLSFDQTVTAIIAHMLGMYIPSLVSGRISRLIGPRWLAVLGFGILCIGNALYFAPPSFGMFVAAITLVGVGWNGTYVGASAVIPQLHDPHEKALVQGTSDMIFLGGTAVVTLLTGTMLTGLGSHGFILFWMITTGLAFCVSIAYALHGAGLLGGAPRPGGLGVLCKRPAKLVAAAAIPSPAPEPSLPVPGDDAPATAPEPTLPAPGSEPTPQADSKATV